MTENKEIDELTLEDLYSWVDQIPLTRPKKDIKRDFSDGVLAAEIVNFFLPHFVELHNYVAALKYDRKITNWRLLNRKVFRKIGFELDNDVIKNICTLQPWAVEHFLLLLRRKIDRYLFEKGRSKHEGQLSDRPEVDQLSVEEQGPLNYQLVAALPNLSSPYTKTGPGPSQHSTPGGPGVPGPRRGKQDMVPKILVEEKEQDILVKEETIQILQAKVRRLEHLLHLKDVRIDDLQNRLDKLEIQLRPTAKPRPPKR